MLHWSHDSYTYIKHMLYMLQAREERRFRKHWTATKTKHGARYHFIAKRLVYYSKLLPVCCGTIYRSGIIWILAPRFEPLQESPVSSEASPEQTETQTNSSLITKSLESESKSDRTFSDSGQSQTYLEVTQVRQVSSVSPSSGDTQTSQSYQSRDSRQRNIRVPSVSPV